MAPWFADHVELDRTYSQTGSFSARLEGGAVNAYLGQTVAAESGQSFTLQVTLGKFAPIASPPVSISIAFYNDAFQLLEYGLVYNLTSGEVPEQAWLDLLLVTTDAPASTARAMVLINKLPLEESAALFVDRLTLTAHSDKAEQPDVSKSQRTLDGVLPSSPFPLRTAYGHVCNNTRQIVHPNSTVSFDRKGICEQVLHPAPDMLQIVLDGDYLLLFDVLVQNQTAEFYQSAFHVTVDHQSQATASYGQEFSAPISGCLQITGSSILRLAAGQQIRLLNAGNFPVTLPAVLGVDSLNHVNASLRLVRLGP